MVISNALALGVPSTKDPSSTSADIKVASTAAAPTHIEMSVQDSFSKLLEGDLYADELNELPDLLLPANVTHDSAASFLSQAAAVNTGTMTPPTTGSISQKGQSSPTTDKRQMEMEFKDWAQSSKAKVAATTTLVQPKSLRPYQAPQLFGKSISFAKQPAPILPPRSSLASSHSTGAPGRQRSITSESSPSGLAPIAPKIISSKPPVVQAVAPSPLLPAPAVVLAPITPVLVATVAPPTLWQQPAVPPPHPVAPKVRQPNEPMFLPAVTASILNIQPPAVPATVVQSVSAAKVAIIPQISAIPAKPKQRRYKRKDPSITDEEAEQAHRNRNKAHAKNTRLRKKAYIEAMKETLNSLTDQRDQDQHNATVEAQKKLQNRQVRGDVMETFLRLRGGDRNMRDQTLGAAILDQAVTLCRPGTPQVVSGFHAVLSDPGEADVVKIMHRSSKQHPGVPYASLSFHYECDKSTLLMDGCTCIFQWKGSTVGATTALGLPSEIALTGSLRAQFNEETNKIVAVVMFYDMGVLRSQLNFKGNVSPRP